MVHAWGELGQRIEDRRHVGRAAGLGVGMVGDLLRLLVEVLVSWEGQEFDELVVG
jgi:hypothetical protein